MQISVYFWLVEIYKGKAISYGCKQTKKEKLTFLPKELEASE